MQESRHAFDLAQWLAWVEQMHTTEIELGLDRVRAVYQRLALDLSSSQIVMVAGTNGKGSTVSFLAEILQTAGFSTAAYTSPHFIRYNERIRLGREEASDAQLCGAFLAVDRVREDVSLTYFEWGTLVALWLIAEYKPDVALLEVGLGGRLDAINIIDADIAVVTSIGLDHVDWLGDDIAQIAVEKAGIARQGRPLVCGADPVPDSLAFSASTTGARLYQKGQQFSAEVGVDNWRWQGIDRNGKAFSYADLPLPNLPLPNASTVLQILALLPLDVSEQAIRHGLVAASMTGRMQHVQLPEGRAILDVAHNPQAAELISQRLSDYQGRVRLVIGMLADKDCQAVLDILAPMSKLCYFASLQGPRAQTAEQLAERLATDQGYQCYDNVAAAVTAARAELADDELILVAGSFFTVAAALESLDMER